MKRVAPVTEFNWWSLHTHSQFSVIDGMVPVTELVRKAHLLGQPAMGLTDHGNMAGTVALYIATKKYGMKAFPGIETYLLDPEAETPFEGTTKRYHACIAALDLTGYKALVKFSSLTHTRPRFWNRFPRALMSDLAELGHEAGDHLVLTTGCYFGLVQQRMDEFGIESARRVIQFYAKYFPHLVVELQDHGIVHYDGPPESYAGQYTNDADMVSELYTQAQALGLPVVVAADSHYLDQRQKKAHALMKRMVYGGKEDEFPGTTFHLPSAEWIYEPFPKDIVAASEETLKHLYDLNTLAIPQLDTYKAYLPRMVKEGRSPDRLLAKLCYQFLDEFVEHRHTAKGKRYYSRMANELEVIKKVGYANYFLLVRKVVKFCNDNHIVVESRGSANGSLVCFALRVTQIDPIKRGTLFERFVSEDRIKPPDIDLDIEADRREEVINWLRQHYEVVRIGTWSELGSSTKDPGRGSVLVSYLSYLRRICEGIAREKVKIQGGKASDVTPLMHAIFNNKGYNTIKSLDDVRRFSEEDWDGLMELADMGSVYRSYGQHASGLLVGTEELPITDLIPTMLVASSDTTVSQFDMDDVELIGLNKLDLLGQRSLTIMRLTQEMVLAGTYKNLPFDDPNDFAWIPEDDKKACAILRSGQMDNGVFHFEGYTKARGGKELGVQSTNDAILVQALYMPGAMDSGQKDLYLRGRRDPSYRRRMSQDIYNNIHPIFEEVLRPTNYAVIYQEQPLQILRKMGMEIAGINKLFKVVKDSGKGAIERNRERMQELREEFNKLCEQKGIWDVDRAWHLCTGFIAYGFNKAHAAGYGVRSYRFAYLKAYFPLEFMTAVLNVNAGTDKEALYVREARRMNLRVLPPHVNVSGASWSIDRVTGAIRKGLVSIKGIGDAAAQEIFDKAPYTSIVDLVTRCSARAVSGGKEYMKTGEIGGKLKDLLEAGALDGLKREKFGTQQIRM